MSDSLRHEKIQIWQLAVAILAIVAGTTTTVFADEIRAFLKRPNVVGLSPRDSTSAVTHLMPQAPVQTHSAPVPNVPTPASAAPSEQTSSPKWSEIPVHSTSASSILPPSRVAGYGPEMVTDGKWATAWVEGAPEYGIGEWIQLDLGALRLVHQIGIVNGYSKGARFHENGRVRNATLRFSDGSSRSIVLTDSNDLQYFPFDPVQSSFVRLTIDSAYPGSRWTDVAISEIRVWTRN